MENVVREAVYGDTNYIVLAHLLEITRTSIYEKRPIFNSIMEEPAFYRRFFKRWVKDEIDQEMAVKTALQEAMNRQD
jgi:hypothetical protein